MLNFHTYMNYLFLDLCRWQPDVFIFIMAVQQPNIGTTAS
ncbi:hypothetical protein A8C14_003350 [Klebsiella aerogenes]|nr:hypothetical protein [Klebsiella aerogenes]EIW9213687.1 hypothetical protein [Klebsiella aerogenes]